MEVLTSLLAILLTILILHTIEFLLKNVALVCLATLLVMFFWLCKTILPSYVEPVPQLREEDGSASVPQKIKQEEAVPVPHQREEEDSVPVAQRREEEDALPVPGHREEVKTVPVLECRNRNNSFSDAISRIDFRLASEPGFIINNEFQRRLRFEAVPEPGRADFVEILDDFWGQLFDFKGRLTKKAKLIRLDALLGLDVQLGIEYSRYFNILMRYDLARPGQPSTLVMPNKIDSAFSELRTLVINSFLYEERRNLDDEVLVRLIIRAHRQQTTSPDNFIPRGPVYEIVKPFIDNNPIWALTRSERDAARISGFFCCNESKLLVLYSFGMCIRSLLSLDGSPYLFSCNYSSEEALVGLLASRVQQLCWSIGQVPNCGKGCIWQGDLIVCFGGWCINRLLELLLVETCIEVWLRCTSLLNRLKGIIELAFLVEQTPLFPCYCFDLADSVAMGLELASNYETGGTRFKRKRAARKMATEAYNRISCRSQASFGNVDVALVNVAIDLMSVLDHYIKELSRKG